MTSTLTPTPAPKNILTSVTAWGIGILAAAATSPLPDGTPTWVRTLMAVVGTLLGLYGRNRVGGGLSILPAAKAVAPVALLALVLGACGTLPGSGGYGTAGAPATAGQAAQTIGGSQGQAPGTATSGTAVVHNNFAATVPPEVALEMLKVASDQHWTADQTVAAFKALAGAPTTVTISGAQTVSSGNASSIPSTSGGAGGVGQSGGGSIVKP